MRWSRRPDRPDGATEPHISSAQAGQLKPGLVLGMLSHLQPEAQWFELLMQYSIRRCWGVTNKLSKKESCIFVCY